MTHYIAAYDTEAPECLAGVRQIVKMHLKHQVPATFFVVAGLLDGQGEEYRDLIAGNPLFEIASHSYTHLLLRDHSLGKAGPPEQFAREIVDSRQRLEDFFGQEVTGFRTPVGFWNGLKGAPRLLDICAQSGLSYVSSLLWGPDDSLPALLVEPFTYAEDGFPALWELPACGWHENILKGHTRLGDRRLLLFPPPMPEASPPSFISTVEEEFAVDRLFIDAGLASAASYVSLVWHPWSLHRFDPEMRMLDLVFSYVKERGLPCRTFAHQRASLGVGG